MANCLPDCLESHSVKEYVHGLTATLIYIIYPEESLHTGFPDNGIKGVHR